MDNGVMLDCLTTLKVDCSGCGALVGRWCSGDWICKERIESYYERKRHYREQGCITSAEYRKHGKYVRPIVDGVERDVGG